MKCKKCGGELRKLGVEVEGTRLTGEAHECRKCGDLLFAKEKGRAIVEKLCLAEKLASKSRLSEKDVKQFSARIKSSATKRFLGEIKTR